MNNSNQLTGAQVYGKRFVSVFLVCTMLAGALAGCGKTEDEKSGTNGEPIEKPKILTNVFKGEDIKTPEDDELRISSSVDMQYKDARIKMLLTKYEETETEDGGYDYHEYKYIYEVGIDGSEPVTTEVVLDDNMYINSGVFTDDGIIFTNNTYDEKSQKSMYNLCEYKLADSSVNQIGDIQQFFDSANDEWFYVNNIKIDSEGYIYLSSDSEVCVLNPDFTKAFSVTAPSYINSLEVSGSKAYVTGYFDKGYSVCEIDKEKKAFGAELEFPESISARNFYFGEGYEIYYSTEEGLFGYNFGTEAGDLIVNWQNSNLSSDTIDRVNVLSKDMLMIAYHDRDTWDTVNAVFKRSADIDLSNITVIEVAYVSRDYNLAGKVTKFNRENDNARVIIKDYSSYNNEENGYTGGETKLVNDIINGLYKPDIICDNGGTIISALNSNGLLRDLYGFMETDPDIKKDDIVGCVKNTYETDGKLTAICPTFNIYTILAKKSDVGDRTSWTMDELLDFAMSLDSDKQLIEDLTSSTAPYLIFGRNPYIQFIDMDNNKCDFNNPTFIKYLEYIATLPKETERDYSYDNNSNRYEAQQTGKTMLYGQGYYDVSDYQSDVVPFNTDEVVRIGFPTSDGVNSGSSIAYAYNYAVTSMSENPDVAWNFLKTLIINKKEDSNVISFRDGISPLKSVNMAAAENLKDRHSFHSFNGGTSSWTGDNDWYTPDENGRVNGEAGILIDFEQAKFDEFMNWLDTIGTPMKSSIPDGIINIINEEISTYVGGAKNAEDTARVIQSRVSLWLAERS